MKNDFSRGFAKLLLPITLFCAVLLGAYLLTALYFGNPANYEAVFAGTRTAFLLSCGCGVVLGCVGTLLLLKRKKNNLYFAPTLACAGCWVSVFAVLRECKRCCRAYDLSDLRCYFRYVRKCISLRRGYAWLCISQKQHSKGNRAHDCRCCCVTPAYGFYTDETVPERFAEPGKGAVLYCRPIRFYDRRR